MKKRIKWVDEFEGMTDTSSLREIPDWLPSPRELAGTSRKRKITIELEIDDINFFKKEAKKLGASYQQMIRNLVSKYAHSFQNQ